MAGSDVCLLFICNSWAALHTCILAVYIIRIGQFAKQEIMSGGALLSECLQWRMCVTLKLWDVKQEDICYFFMSLIDVEWSVTILT